MSRPNIIQQTEEEFGQPFLDVVRGFAADGYGKDGVARILGYTTPVAFRKLLKRHPEWVIDWPSAGEAVRTAMRNGAHPSHRPDYAEICSRGHRKRANFWPLQWKHRAVELRKAGKTYDFIADTITRESGRKAYGSLIIYWVHSKTLDRDSAPSDTVHS